MFNNLKILEITTTQEDCDYWNGEYNEYSFFLWMEGWLAFEREGKHFEVLIPFGVLYDSSRLWYPKFQLDHRERLHVSCDEFIYGLTIKYKSENEYQLSFADLFFKDCSKEEVLKFITDINKLYLEECKKYPNGEKYVEEYKSRGFLSYDAEME